MIDSIAIILKDRIKIKPYVGRIAGLTRTAVQMVQVDAGDGQNVTLSEKRFPIACNVEGLQCWNQGKYQELAPNQNYQSLMYFEQLGASSYIANHRDTKTKTRLRLVCWFNLAKMGLTVCSTPESIIFELIEAVTTTGATGTGVNYQTNAVLFQRSPDIFLKYSYDRYIIENMLLYPYDYFAIDIDVECTISKGCFSPFVPLTEITCIDLG